MPVKMTPLAAIGAGALFVYSGIRGFSVLMALRNVIKGTAPNTGQHATLLSVPASAGSSGNAGNIGGGFAGIASSYVGKLRYVFGGPPPIGTVDCSSFASKVLHEGGISAPGGQLYSASTHGPNTISYLSWSGARTIGHSASMAQENDLCVWQTHMGICIGGGKMVSARDPQEGVGVDDIAGDMPGELLFVRRLV